MGPLYQSQLIQLHRYWAGDSMQVAHVVKIVGILLASSFSPSIHCREAASKARRMLFLIRWSFAQLSVSAFAALYNTLVRPHLEYAMQACSPNLAADADCLEQIQRLATRLVKGFRRLPYEERLRRLSLHSSRRRRLHGDLIDLMQCVFRIVSGPQSLFFRQCGQA